MRFMNKLFNKQIGNDKNLEENIFSFLLWTWAAPMVRKQFFFLLIIETLLTDKFDLVLEVNGYKSLMFDKTGR